MQQQLAALLSSALPKEDSTTSSSSSSSSLSTPSSSSSSSSAPVSSSSSTLKQVPGNETDESARLAAINSLHRAILYPPNSLLVSHSASFLSQGLSQLLNDKLYSVRQAAATAYGALCAIVCSILLTSNRRQNHVVLGSMVDRYIGWALPLLKTGDTTAELALDSLREFLNVGDVNGIERYALPILKACQQLLEDERTSLSLLHRLLGVLTLISLKFFRCFQPHFLDIVDLLLGWALVPDLAESDRSIIMDCFLQFQKHWVADLQFSHGLLSKFLDDMDALLHDGSPGNQQQFKRLLALLSCFSTVLQSTASGLLEISLLEQISEPLCLMLPRLLGCLSVVGHKFGWSKWAGDLWKCLTLLAEILCEKFSVFYPLAVDTLFQSLEVDGAVPCVGGGKIASVEVHEVLKTNLQLLSLQKLGLLPSSVQKVLQFDAPISQLRLHPNHIVTASSAATYVFLLQHGNGEVVQQTKDLLLAELELLKSTLEKVLSSSNEVKALDIHSYSKSELFALIKFDLKVLLTCVFLGGNSSSSLIGQPDLAILYLNRSEALLYFIVENLNPFHFPIKDSVELQVNIMTTLEKLSRVELLSKCASHDYNQRNSSVNFPAEKAFTDITLRDSCLVAIMEHLRKYSELLVKALHVSSPLEVKVVALKWVQSFCKQVLEVMKHLGENSFFFEPFVYSSPFGNIYSSILDGASDREPKVRLQVASILELLLQAKLVHPADFYFIGQRILEKLGDPNNDMRNAFVRLLSHAVPIFVYSCGLCEYGMAACMPNHREHNCLNLQWKQLFALKQLPQQLSAPQLVAILSYISQRWKVPLSTWIKRLIHSCRRSKDHVVSQHEETGNFVTGVAWLEAKLDEDVLENICSVNVLAGAWWAIQEAARYCIATRLRTNLGGPSQTFAALERMLLDVAHVMQLDSEQNDGSLSIINSSGAHILPMRLLLDFVEALKKNVYNAYEGSAVLPSVSRQSSLFFRANKKVCEEWFSRICEPMMNAGLALQCHYATIEYCTLRLHDIQSLVNSALKDKSRSQVLENLKNVKSKFSGEVLRVLRHLALAMCRCYEPEALVGLQTWVSKTFSSLLIEDYHPVDHAGDFRPLAWINGLVYQARGQYEKAAAHFIHLLQSEESLNLMGSDGVQFAIARIIESYSAVSDWKSLESWLLELQMLRAKHAGKSYSGALTTAGNEINAILALAHFDQGEFQAAWTCLDLTPKSSSELALDPKVAFQRSEQMLLQALLLHMEGKVEKVPPDLQKAKLMLEEELSVLPLDGLVDSSAYAIQLHCISALEDGIAPGVFQDGPRQIQSLFGSYVHPVKYPISKMHQDCYPWSKVLRVYRSISPTSPVTLSLGMNLLALARKQKNLLLGNRLSCYLREHLYNCPEEMIHSSLLSNLEYEEILLKYAHNDFEGAFTSLWSFLHPCMISPVSIVPYSDDSILKAKACLKLSKWLKGDYSDLCVEIIVPRIQEDLKDVDFSFPVKDGKLSINENLIHKQSISLITEEIVGTVAKLSTHLCPIMGKSWISYASWCFGQARNSMLNLREAVLQRCTFSSSLVSEVQPDRFRLNEDEATKLKSIVLKLVHKMGDAPGTREIEGGDSKSFDPATMSNDKYVNALVQQVEDIIEDSSGAEASGGQCLSTSVASRLQTFFLHLDMDVEKTDLASIVDELINIWWSLRRRRVSLFGHAAYGFIQYLSHAASKGYNDLSMGSGYESLKHRAESLTLRATLYVLHILLNYGVELQDSLEPSLSSVPLLSWQEVIPQLFARLSSHPEQVVRRQLEGLLIMLGKQSPWSIVYPTLLDVNANEEKPSEELQHILASLRELHPRLVQDVQLMMNELSNVTVLWEELWLSTLQDLHADVMRRIHVLKEESARIAENVALSQSEKNKINAARYSAMMAPIIVTLERRLASTSRKPETPHELWFCEQYSEQLKSAIFIFKTPPRSAAALGEVWRPFDIITASLASYQRKSSVSLGEVAPQLALLSSSDVPMPGLEKQGTLSYADGLSDKQDIVTISSFSEQVAILSTKTKPKKIVMMGSDGRNYTYLLKGREDLRLDARIMQLLQAVNGLLGSCPTTRGRLVGIRYYSVTPISGRAGLIQWVDNVISIYTVFRCWQTRAQSAQLSSSGNGNTKSSVPPVPRPNDMFYGKIIPALKEKGIRRVISRRDWPQEVKLKVLLDLMKEIPRQLLYLELWCASDGFKEFSLKLKRYSGSVAAMSMVGHILGLGDRHLDNILVDFGSGDIVHIDYNICFDKGQRLKIPEIVPFRLTQMIEAALGLAGVEGTFRANCEAVMDVLRKNKDIILMLLEVFVWDPLVEWTRGDFHDDAAIGGEERKGMELAVSLSLFASRVQEIRASLQEHHDLLLSTLPAVESALEKFADILSKYEHVSALFCRVDQERSNLIMHETSAKSIVAEATCTSEKVRQSFEIQAQEFSQAKALVAEKAQEAMNWLEQHGRILEGLRDNLFTEIKGWIELGNMGETLSLIRAVPAAGVPISVVPEPTKAQCLEIDREVCLLVADLDHGVSSSLTAIHVYSLALQRILPLNYVTTSKIHGWAQVLQLCSNVLSSDVLSLARRQASDLISNMSNDTHDASTFTHNDLCLKMDEYASNMRKLEEECAELVNSLGIETGSKAKDRLLSSFMKYTQLGEIDQKEDSNLSQAGQSKHDSTKSISHQIELIEKREKALFVLNSAVTSLYADIKSRTMDIGDITKKPGSSTIISELEEQVEKLSLISSFQMELQQLVDRDTRGPHNSDHEELHSKDSWPSIFQSILGSSKSFIDQMAEIVLPDVMRIAISFNSEVLDTFGSISQVRGAIDTALEQLVEVEMERESLVELEQNYFVRVGLITEQQLALKEAAVKGRDHLSWEEAEELASQEEACRAQLDLLHQTWNQRDKRTSTLFKREAEVKNSLTSSEKLFHTLAAVEQDVVSQVSRSKALLASLIRPFSELESFNRVLSSMCGTLHAEGFPKLANLLKSGYSVSECIWKVGGSLSSHAFFIWKIFVVDAFLDSCIQDVALSADQSLGFDQLLNVLKKKILIQLEKLIGQYLKEYVLPILVVSLDLESERLKQLRSSAEELGFEIIKKDTGAVQKVKYMLEEFCNAHETARAARSVASLMKRQVNELKEAICKTGMEIVKMEWMHDALLTTSQNSRVTLQKFLSSDDDLRPIVTKLSRSRLLEVLHSAVSRLAQSVESLQTVERTTHTAEAQLERAMGWACGGPSSSVAGNTSGRLSGIPPQFHEHLMRRRQLLWDAREKASKIAKICMSILEFEASRDGILWVPGERAQWTSNDHRAWQQAYFSSLTRLEVAYHAFSRVEQEWNLAQSSMEAASNGLYSATNELCIASVKAKSASDDLHNTVLSMRDCAYEARVALSAFCRVMRGHTALTSECSSMLEEVLAVTEDLHDVHSLGKEAASVHDTLMDDLAKAGAILLPLESVLSKDVAAMTEAISRERESKMGISPIHGQAIYQSYCSRVREACQALEPLLPSLLQSVKDLLVILTRLARTASLHAGNLHKALEGVGESQEEKSEGVDILRPDFSGNVSSFDEREGELSVSDEGATQEILEKLSLPEKAWLSPPDSICNSSSESSIASSDADFLDSSSDQKSDMVQQLHNFDCRDESGHPLTDFSSQADIYRVKTSDSQTQCIENANTCREALVISEPLPCTELVASQADEHAIVPLQNSCSSHEEDSKMKHRDKDKQFLDGSRYEDENNEDPELGMHANGRVARGKNAYAISVLRRVEMKLDGRDISDAREISVAEQVDYLLKQATSVDNLCNMYEGWTPWI